ncbi:unnamed protein product, partial [Brenthis ino]
MLIAVVVAFFVCWAPFHAQRLVAIYGTSENHLAKSPILLSVYYFLTYTSGVFYYMSTCINPVFYHIMSYKFRDAFKNTMAQWFCRNSNSALKPRCSYTTMPISRQKTPSGLHSEHVTQRDKDWKLTYKRSEREKSTSPRVWKICERCKRTMKAPDLTYDNICSHKLQTNLNVGNCINNR